MKLSLIDLSVVPVNGDRHQAVLNTIDTAQRAEALGFERIWLAEHHASNGLVGRAPEVLIPMVAAQTKTIKVGSGSVLLNHYSPYKVAENFTLLAEMFPGRIDMGIGRATNGLYVDIALQRNRTERPHTSDSAEQLAELMAWMHGDFEADHPFKLVNFDRSYQPDASLLGSSAWSAQAGAYLGMPYAFAGFINPQQSYSISRIYKDQFRPSEKALCSTTPKMILALWVFCAETEEEAARMAAPIALSMKRLMQGDTSSLMESEDRAIELLGGVPPIEPLEDPRMPPRFLIGTPEQVEQSLNAIAEVFEVDEIMIQCGSPHHEKRMRSLELLSQQFKLKK